MSITEENIILGTFNRNNPLTFFMYAVNKIENRRYNLPGKRQLRRAIFDSTWYLFIDEAKLK